MPRSNVEHINGDRSNNRWRNLREGVRSQKAAYRAPLREPTGVSGVWKVGGRFDALVDVQGVTTNLGSFGPFE